MMYDEILSEEERREVETIMEEAPSLFAAVQRLLPALGLITLKEVEKVTYAMYYLIL